MTDSERHRSPFAFILERLCAASRNVVAACLVDDEGECVDVAMPPKAGLTLYDLQVVAAHMQILGRQLMIKPTLERPEPYFDHWDTVRIDGKTRGFILLALPYEYLLIVLCHPGRALEVSGRLLAQIGADTCSEAGFKLPEALGQVRWHGVAVRIARGVGARGLKCRILDTWLSGEIQAELDAGASRERRLRVILRGSRRPPAARGGDASPPFDLVREPTGHWFLGASSESQQWLGKIVSAQ